MADHKSLADLKKCMREAHSDADRTACETKFTQAGGTVAVAEGGKVFSAQDGGQAFVSKGGKVFSPEA